MTKQVKEDDLKSSVPSNVRRGELSSTGLSMIDGRIFEETISEFQWPNLIRTCKLMSSDESVYAAENVIKSIIRNIKWRVETPDIQAKDKTEEMLYRENFIKECMDDMDTSFSEFINEALSFLTYGFSVHEKVYKIRKGQKGKYFSKFDDGKMGWAKLPIRAQDTIKRWIFDDKAQNLIAIEQDLSTVNTYAAKKPIKFQSEIEIPINKILHVKHDVQKGNPEGRTPLRACYTAWRYKTTIAEFEAIGVSRDMNGMPVIGLPPEYMSADASDDKKAVYEYCKDIIRNIHMNEQAGIVFPRDFDEDTKKDRFEFKLISVEGSKQFDTDKIINRYENKMLMAYMADVLKMGQETQGSFALSDNKTNLLSIGIESILKEILDTINRDLIVQTAIMNGWDLNKPLPRIVYEELEDRDLEKLGSFIQKCVSVGAMEIDQTLSEKLRKEGKLPSADETKPIRENLMTPSQSKSGEGFKSAGDGTSTNPSGGDAAVGNASKNTS